MSYTKEKIENTLKDLLYECLSSVNQESAIKSVSYDEKTKECTIIMNTCIIEEDDYIGFDGY